MHSVMTLPTCSQADRKRSEMKTFKHRDYVKADRVESACVVGTHTGPQTAKAGDYVMYVEDKGAFLVNGEDFDRDFVEIKGDPDFHPTGNTVETVLAFLDDNPDEMTRIKGEESEGANRKGIMEY